MVPRKSSPPVTHRQLQVQLSPMRADIDILKKDVSSLRTEMYEMEKRITLYFDMRCEQMVVDFRDIFSDRTYDLYRAREDHEARIRRLEARR
jgi:hypothetical protein